MRELLTKILELKTEIKALGSNEQLSVGLTRAVFNELHEHLQDTGMMPRIYVCTDRFYFAGIQINRIN